jgi:hypothetical protein
VIDCERETFIANGVRQYVPLPSVQVYLDTYLMPAINVLEAKHGRLPIIYCNLDFVKNYFSPIFGQAKYAKLFQCPLWLALWTSTPPRANIASPYWEQWAFWQKKGDVRDNPGVSDIDYNEWPGSRTELKSWIADPNFPIPPYTVDNVPPPPAPVTATFATINTVGLRMRTKIGVSANDPVVGYMQNGAVIKAGKVIQDGDNAWVEFTGYFAAKYAGKIYAKLVEKPVE